MKIGILYNLESSHWQSCKTISSNLEKAYQCLENSPKLKITWHPLEINKVLNDQRSGTGYLLKFAQQLYDSKIDCLVITDHHTNPLPLLLALRSISIEKFTRLKFAIHIYGDFTIFATRWVEIGKLLKGLSVRLICSSKKQGDLVSYFETKKTASATIVIPFPVNTQNFMFSPRLRQKTRKQLKLTSDTKLILYVGRISLQKNVISLIELFHQMALTNPKLHLGIAGELDDIGGTTLGISMKRGYLYHKLHETLKTLPFKIRQRIIMFGPTPHQELTKLYSASDLAMSLSLYHDEDFGMAPAESLASGLPTILTNWGGYSSFSPGNDHCHLIPVHFERRGLRIDYDIAGSLIAGELSKTLSSKERIKNSDQFHSLFSIESVAENLESIYLDKFSQFSGFNKKLDTFAKIKTDKKLYHDIYSNYTSEAT